MAKQELEEIIALISEDELAQVMDFLEHLRNKTKATDILLLQMSSKSYLDWISPENDIYDEVFKDEIDQR